MGIASKHSYRFVYLKSEQWQTVRLSALARENARCQICMEESISNDVHHIWYPESIWDTTERHVVVLCRSCHDFLHTMMPECKTSDEDEGYGHWLRFKNAISDWRVTHAQMFPFKEAPKDLRLRLEEFRVAKAAPRAPEMTHAEKLDQVLKLIRRWASDSQSYAISGQKGFDSSDYMI